MKEAPYKKFSLGTHVAGMRSGRPSVCHFELTFRCGLDCEHCLTSCYDTPECASRELSTRQVLGLLDKIRAGGVLWLCLSGGDPLERQDFPEIYAHAKSKGFIVTIFTSGVRLAEHVALFKRLPPFSIEMTLNAVDRRLYEKITGTQGAFEKVMSGIRRARAAKLPLKLKAQITASNLAHLAALESFARKIGARFAPAYKLYARLDGDAAPCRLRVPPKLLASAQAVRHPRASASPFFCAALSGDGFRLDPSGNLYACELIREARISLRDHSLGNAIKLAQASLEKMKFTSRSRCRACDSLSDCGWCPGQAYLEKGDATAPLEYYCRAAHQS